MAVAYSSHQFNTHFPFSPKGRKNPSAKFAIHFHKNTHIHEHETDVAKWQQSPALFLPSSTVAESSGFLTIPVINSIWNEVANSAKVEGKTPHSARHAMGRHIIEQTGNIAAVQRQLGHRNATHSVQYARITAEELGAVLEER